MGGLDEFQKLAIWVLPVLFGITLHEVAHGWIAEKLGDPTARRLGRISLNPIKHVDPIGTVVVPLVLFFAGGFLFGWAKPVPVTYENLRRPKRDMALVALAGPGANLVMALGWALLMRFAADIPGIGEGPAYALTLMGYAGLQINIVLMVLNLLPLPPLDGSRVAMGVLPDRLGVRYARLEPYGLVILLLLMISGALAYILAPAVSVMMQAIARLLMF